jgi:hypothetical protein
MNTPAQILFQAQNAPGTRPKKVAAASEPLFEFGDESD